MNDILFKNEHCIAVDKASGFLTIPPRLSPTGQIDSRPVLIAELQNTFKQKFWVVHRLDFEVSGVILFSLSKHSHRLLNIDFEKDNIKKKYHALTPKFSTLGQAPPQINQDLNIESTILFGKKRAFVSPYGKRSVTVCKIIAETNEYFLWEIHPLTGRTHQIRFHLASLGFPILGDTRYGSNIPYRVQNGIALRSQSLHFLNKQTARNLDLPETIMALDLPL